MRIFLMGAAVAATLLSSAGIAQARSLGSLPLAALLFDAGQVTDIVKFATPPGSQKIVTAPRGYAAMCARDTRLCDIGPASTDTAMSERSRLTLLSNINVRVNRSVRPQAELALGDDQWLRPGPRGTGDCEDYAIEKREELKAAGFPAGDLSYAVVYRRDTGLHTLLVARIGNKQYVLDNLSRSVVEASRAPYTWVKQQSRSNPMIWQAALRAPDAEPRRAIVRPETPSFIWARLRPAQRTRIASVSSGKAFVDAGSDMEPTGDLSGLSR